MSEIYRRIGIIVDVATGEQIYPDGLPVRRRGGYPKLIFDETVILCVNFRGQPEHFGEPLTESSLPETLRYTLSGGTLGPTGEGTLFYCGSELCNLSGDFFDGTTAQPEKGELSFRLRSGTRAFLEAAEQGIPCELVIVGMPSSGEQIVMGRCRFIAVKRASDIVPPESGGATVEVANVDFHPVVQFTIADERCGRCVSLNAVTSKLIFADHVYGAVKLRLRIVSGDFHSSGNIVLVPRAAGVELTPVTVPVGASIAVFDLVFAAPVTGALELCRNFTANDTLGEVAALIVSIEVHHEILG